MYRDMKKHMKKKKKSTSLQNYNNSEDIRNEDSERQKGEVIVPSSRCRSLSKAGVMSSNY